MKRSILLYLAVALAPLAASAQDGPPPDPLATPNPQAVAAMRQSFAQMQQLRHQGRAQMLAALTPAHRLLLANIFGQLAVSVDPNPQAAAAQIDAALAPAEKQSIVTIETAQRANARAIMQQARSVAEAAMSADQRAHRAQMEAQHEAFARQHSNAGVADPGLIVLRMLGNVGGPHLAFGPGAAHPPPPGM